MPVTTASQNGHLPFRSRCFSAQDEHIRCPQSSETSTSLSRQMPHSVVEEGGAAAAFAAPPPAAAAPPDDDESEAPRVRLLSLASLSASDPAGRSRQRSDAAGG